MTRSRRVVNSFLMATALIALEQAKCTFGQAANSSGPKIAKMFPCPEQLTSDTERRESLDSFLKAYTAQNPNASVRDAMLARDQLLVSNHCTQALDYMLGHISAIAQMLRFNDRSYDRAETEFDASTHVWTVYFDPENVQPDLADRGLIINFYNWNPPSSAADIAQALGENRGSTTSIYKFQAPDEITKLPAYFIVSEAIHADRGYGYANISKVSPLGSGAYAVTYDQKISGKNALEIEMKIRNWLMTDEAKKIEKVIASVGVDRDWQDALTKSN